MRPNGLNQRPEHAHVLQYGVQLLAFQLDAQDATGDQFLPQSLFAV
jgi:hypothetical protein